MNYPTKKVLICAPVRDRAWILGEYLDALMNIDYPKECLGFYFLLNDSEDESEQMLMKFKADHKSEYREITIDRMNLVAPKDKRAGKIRRTIYTTLAKLRNCLLEHVGEYDYLFSVDTDIVVEPNVLKELVGANKDMCGVVIANDYGVGRICNIMNESGNNHAITHRHVMNYPKDTYFRVDVTGAISLMKAEVCRVARYDFDKLGEDIAFCVDVKSKGFEVWACSKRLAEHKMRRM